MYIFLAVIYWLKHNPSIYIFIYYYTIVKIPGQIQPHHPPISTPTLFFTHIHPHNYPHITLSPSSTHPTSRPSPMWPRRHYPARSDLSQTVASRSLRPAEGRLSTLLDSASRGLVIPLVISGELLLYEGAGGRSSIPGRWSWRGIRAQFVQRRASWFLVGLGPPGLRQVSARHSPLSQSGPPSEL